MVKPLTLTGFRIILFSYILSACSIVNQQQKGTVTPNHFTEEIDFKTAKSIILLPVRLDTVTKNFLFDTGADFNVIQRETLTGTISQVSGASKRKMKVGNEIVKSIKIGKIDFQNTYSMNGNLTGLKEQIPDFGGIIGLSVINKSNWLINYPQNRLLISDRNLADNTFRNLDIRRKNGASYIRLRINGRDYLALVDLGSSSALSIPLGSKLANVLLSKHKFISSKKESYTMGGLQQVQIMTGTLEKIVSGDIEFINTEATIKISSQLRVGNKFFQDYSLYIDNTHQTLKLKKTR